MDFGSLLSIAPFAWDAIGTAMLCGFIIGLERQLRGKPVGVRTSMLIVLGTYMFIVAGGSIANESADSTRIIGQVITGIGFLGAGVMLARDGIVMGVTSAATIWALASIGVGIAVGNHLTSIKMSFVVVGVLVGVDVIENYSQAMTRGVHQRYAGWRGRDRRRKDLRDDEPQ